MCLVKIQQKIEILLCFLHTFPGNIREVFVKSMSYYYIVFNLISCNYTEIRRVKDRMGRRQGNDGLKMTSYTGRVNDGEMTGKTDFFIS